VASLFERARAMERRWPPRPIISKIPVASFDPQSELFSTGSSDHRQRLSASGLDGVRGPLRVIRISLTMSESLPLIPREQRYSGRRGTSYLCQFLTHAPQNLLPFTVPLISPPNDLRSRLACGLEKLSRGCSVGRSPYTADSKSGTGRHHERCLAPNDADVPSGLRLPRSA